MTKEQENEVINDIVSANRARCDVALRMIYKSCYSTIEAYIIKNNGDQSSARDIFQDGIVVLYQNIVRNKFRGNASISTYLFSICKNLWLQQLKKNMMTVADDNIDGDELSIHDIKEAAVNIKAVDQIMAELKQDCREILIGFYYKMKSMKELAESFNLGSEQAAKNKKSRCLKYLTNMIRKKGLAHENFFK